MRNLKLICWGLLLILTALACRLAYIQILGHDELYAATRSQSLISLEGSNTRGIIYDRNGEALVADEKKYVYIIKEDNFTKGAETLLDKVNAARINSDNEGYYVFSSADYDKETGHKLIENYGAYILQAAARYSEEQVATHLIGYVNKKDNSGAAGLELMCDEQLSGLNRNVYAVADVKGNILPGRGLLITSDDENDSYIKEGIRTTVDRDLQTEVENIIDENENNCAVVVLDSNTGGVVAMASTPGFDPNNADSYMNNTGSELINKATQGAYPPGSIFKIVVAAAALENGIDTDKTYSCVGNVELEEISIKCDTGGEGGHGSISFEDAFAKSCNSFFIQLGREIGEEAIIETAEKMGLGQRKLADYPQEVKGHVTNERQAQGDGIGNLSIGQGELLVTPIQAAAMTNIIANGGIDKGVHILMDEEESQKQVISQKTAVEVGKMMKKVTEDGTGGIIEPALDGSARASVKTGTAEYYSDGETKTHGWMTGFTPCDNPEYVITVFVEGGNSGALSAGPIFRDIINYLEESGSYSRPTLA